MKTGRLLCSIAKKLPDVEEGVACEGTAIESRTFRIKRKAFLFVGPKHALVKNGKKWLKLDVAETRPREELTALVTASYRAFAKGKG